MDEDSEWVGMKEDRDIGRGEEREKGEMHVQELEKRMEGMREEQGCKVEERKMSK